MELFARELQDNPQAMLHDLITLYCMTYALAYDEVAKQIRADMRTDLFARMAGITPVRK